MLSFIPPVIARCKPITWSSNFGHNTPGVSNNSKSWLILIHCCTLVTPGLSPTAVTLLPTKALIKVDLPTLGIPTIIVLIARGFKPLAKSFALFSTSKLVASLTISLLFFNSLESKAIALLFCFS